MTDASVKTGVPVSHKVRTTVVRGGRGGNTPLNAQSHPHSKNKTWIAGRASSSPAPEGRWERGRGGIVTRGRGGRSAHAGVNGHASNGTAALASVTEDEDDGASEAGPSRLATPAPPSTINGVVKSWEELVKARDVERAQAIRDGKMDDPTKPKRLEEAITIVGTCQDMCPEFERYRRERENNLDKWECIIGPDGKPTKKVDHARAVKIYERGQGDKIIPSDLRPAPILKRTLDYLFHDLIPRGGFSDTQAFVRDRSRAVRNDFTIQQDRGPVAIECHERCTRFHILSLHLMYDTPTFDRALEIQQLMNSLLSLKEFYDDQRGVYQSPNELEMRIYHRLGLIRDQHERNDRPPPHIASDPVFQLITRFRSEVQAASSPITKTSKMKVNDAAMQTFAELVGVLRERRNTVMIYLMACFLEHIFGKDTIEDMESIKGSLSIQDIIDGNSDTGAYVGEVDDVEDADMDDEAEQGDTEEQDELSAFIEEDEDVASAAEEGVAEASQPEGEATAPRGPTISQSMSAPGLFSTTPFGSSTTQPSFTPIPPSQSVFGKIVSSSSTPSAFGNTGSSSVFGTAFNAFNASSNVFGGPVFGAPSSSSTPPKIAEVSKQAASAFPRQPSPSVPSSQSAILQDTKPLRSLADAPALASAGEEDHVNPSEAVQISKPPPFPTSQSAPSLNPFAPSFEPSSIKSSQSSTFPTASRPNLTPIRTDSPLNRKIDPVRGVFATPVDSPSQSIPPPQKAPSGSALSLDTGPPAQPPTEAGRAHTLDSPVAPPTLGRKESISLPGTPTTPVTSGSMPPVEPTTPSTPYHFPAPRVDISSTTASTPNPIPSSSSRRLSARKQGPRKRLLSPEAKRSLKEQAYIFKLKHSLAPVIYKRWKKKMLDTAKWKEACRRSEEYKQKIHESTSNGSIGSMPSSSSFKRQRSEAELQTEYPKRPRRSQGRPSIPGTRLTDDELAEKLMKNREKHERRWARGLFVKAIREYVLSRVDEVPSNWATWLCMNPDNDKTAIWLEQKFDVPKSGSWESESVFSIPISTNPSSEVHPGLIVFECTPLEEVDDEIEKKYRVLDDCSRLRDIISLLPENRHYTPSLLFINWDASPSNDIHSDITDMATKYVEEGILRNSVRITMTSDDTDVAFAKCLPRLNTDLRGDYVEKLKLSDLFEQLSESWKDAARVWTTACLSEETLDWLLFSHVVEHFVESLNSLLKIVLSAWNEKHLITMLLPAPSFGVDRDPQSVINAIHDWVHASGLAVNYNGLEEGALTEAVFNDLHSLGLLTAKRYAKDSSRKHAIRKEELERLSSEFAVALQQSQNRLRKIIKGLPRPSPKRKINGVHTNGHATRESVSQASSLSPPTPSMSAKRARVSESFETLVDGGGADQSFAAPASPTPSVATSIGNSSVSGSVTAAMLRELSRDILKKYGSPKRKSLG